MTNSTKEEFQFVIRHDPAESPERLRVLVDDKFDVTIIRSPEGLIVDVFTKQGMIPLRTITLWEDEIDGLPPSVPVDDIRHSSPVMLTIKSPNSY